MRLLCLLVAAQFFLLSAPAHAAKITFDKAPDNGTGVIFIEGEIHPGDDERFREISLQLRSAVVMLNSNGGSLMPALEIGKIIGISRYDTAVLYDNVCASSCALVWLAGANREVMGGGRVGFHAAYRDNAGRLEEVGAANALIGSYLTSLGLPTRAILFATSAPPDRILWLTEKNMKDSGLDYTHIVGPPPPIQIAPARPKSQTPPPIQMQPPVQAPLPASENVISSLSRSGEKWIKLRGFRNAYYDESSIEIGRTKRKAWILYDYSNQMDVYAEYELKLTEVDCKKDAYRVDRIVSGDRDRRGLSSFLEPAPGSLERALVERLCSIK